MAEGFRIAKAFVEVGTEDNTESGLASIGRNIKGWIAGLGIGALMTKAIGGGISAFATFEQQMNEVFSLLPGISQSAMDDMSSQVKKFSKDFGVLPEQVVPSLYEALSSGVPADNVFSFLETAQKAAKGGVTELAVAVDGITSVVNAYGADVIDATTASDMMFEAVKGGKMTFDEMANTMAGVTPLASSLGLNFGNVTASMATMTAQGIPAAESVTQLRSMLAELSTSGTEVADVFEEVSGKSFKEFIAGGGNLQDALMLLEQHAADSGIGINELFGSIEAGGGALALTGKATDLFKQQLDNAANSAGSTQAAYDAMNRGIKDAWEEAKAAASVALIDLGDKLAPAVEMLGRFAADSIPRVTAALGIMGGIARDYVMPVFQSTVWPTIQTIFSTIAGVVRDQVIPVLQSTVWPWLVGVFWNIVSVVQNNVLPMFLAIGTFVMTYIIPALQHAAWPAFIAIVGALWATLSFLGNILLNYIIPALTTTVTWIMQNADTIGIVVAAITVLLLPALIKMGVQVVVTTAMMIARFILWQTITAGAMAMQVASLATTAAKWVWMGWVATANAAKVVAGWVVMGAKAVAGVAVQVAQFAIMGAKWVWIGLQATAAATKTVAAYVAMKTQALLSAAAQLPQFILMGAKWVWLGITALAAGAQIALAWLLSLGPIGLVIAAVIAIAALLIIFWDEIKAAFFAAVTWIGDMLSAAWDGIKNIATAVWDGIKNYFTNWWNDLILTYTVMVLFIKNYLEEKWNEIKSKISEVWDGIKQYFSDWWNGLVMTYTVMLLYIKNVLEQKWNEIKTGVSTIWNAIKTFFTNWWNNLKSQVQTAIDLVKGYFNRWGDIITKVKEIFNSVKEGAKDKLQGMLDYVATLKDKIKSKIGNIKSALIEKGKDVVRGIWDGIKAMGGWLKDKIIGWAQDAIPGPVADALGISSPSRVMRDQVGKWIPEGIGEGVEAGTPKMLGSLRDMADQIPKSVNVTGDVKPVGHAAAAERENPSQYFAEGSIVLDASKIQSIQDLLEMLRNIRSTSRQYGANYQATSVR